MRYIGIDPGKGGAIAFLENTGKIVHVEKMPDSGLQILGVLKRHRGIADCRAALEYVRSSPQMGVTSAFTFGRGLGALEMALVALRVPYYEVHPRRWQKALDCLTGGDKNVSKAKAAELWPDAKVTHANADALLLAEWVRRKHVGLIVEQSADR